MEAKPGRLVKAVYDFPTDDPEELSLLVGDVVQVKERIDKQWSRGICAGREGNFPTGFTVDVKTPRLEEHQQLFVATNDFIAQEEGDLTLKKGDLVVGTNAIDSNWWRGENNGVVGIFPLTHVWQVDKSILPDSKTSRKMFARAKVKMNMTAQLAEEMDLYKDEIVNIIEEVEKGWYRGECNGRHGIFPALFVTILPNSTDESSTHATTAENSVPISVADNLSDSSKPPVYDSKYGYDCINSGITAYGRALYPFQAEYPNELSLKGGEIVNLIKHVDENWIEGEIDGKTGIFPANFVNIIVDCPKSSKLSESSDSACEADANLFSPDTYGRVISDFHPEYEGDVALKEGDTVTLIRKIDSNWYEVETDNGDCGICPESYIEVIGSGPPSYSEVMASLSGHNSALTYIDSFSNHTKTTQSTRPLSFASSASDSSFSSQNSANDTSCSRGALKMMDAENVIGLDSSLLTSDAIFNDRSSSADSNNLRGNTSQRMDFLSSTYDSSPRLFGADTQSVSSVPGNNQTQSNSSMIPSIVRTPPRPPPPANISLSPNTSVNNNSFNSSVNSARQSSSSASSHGSFDSSFDSVSDSDVQNQIQMKEQALKQRISCLSKLENELKNTSNSAVSSEIRAQISQLSNDIDRLKRDIGNLNAKLKPDTGQTVSDESSAADWEMREAEVERKRELENKRREQEKINKMKEQRSCIITELLQSEKDYVSDLKLLNHTFMSNLEESKEKGINMIAVFGNLDEVIRIAEQLLRRLQKVAQNDGCIGECFINMSDELKEVYGHYCRNHDDATSILDKIDPQSPAGQLINHKLEILKRQINCFDLGAMLIKPVQRILKYPLLIDQLLKSTDDKHPDKPGLKQAIDIMSDVATAINEFKRRKDLVFKYRKNSDISLSDRISKINLHSVSKKSSRFGTRLSASIGLNTMIVDKDYDEVVKKFKAIEKSLHIFLKDLTEYTKKSEELYTCAFSLAEGIAELYQERKTQQEVDQFRSAHRIILTEYWESFKQSMDRGVHSSIKQLLQAYEGPKNLMAKRQDKLLDYIASTKRMERNKDATKIKILQETQSMDKNNYEALNSQLLDDLPKLCNLSIDILCDCIHYFLKAKKNFIGRTARHMLGLMDLPLMLGSQGSGILETFQVKHTLVMDDLSRLSIAFKQFQSCIKPTDTLKKNSSPKGSRLSFGGASSAAKFQTDTQKVKIKSTYPQSQLYTANENFDAVDIMDISLKKGDVVGVIKQQDPMGNKTKWFVDTGDARGFVPAKCLMKFLPGTSSLTDIWNTPQNTSSSPAASGTNTANRHSLYAHPNGSIPQLQPQTQQNVSPQLQPRQNVSPQQQTLPRQSISPQSQLQARQNISPQSSAQTRTSISPQAQVQPRQNISPHSQVQTSQNVSPQSQQTRQNSALQPSRPVPPITASLRMVAPSRYPPVSTSGTPMTKENNPLSNLPRIVLPPSPAANTLTSFSSNVPSNINSNSNTFNNEPEHRYEEIPDLDLNSQIRTASSPSTTRNNTSNILDEFDPYSSSSVPEVYDNVPDNLNSMYSSHRYEDIPDRYEDIPDDSYYDEVPNEAKAGDAVEYYYALYDFNPTGSNQLLLRKGQVVLVLHKCDLNQNSEWWFVEDRHGNKGYVPSQYLNKYSKDVN